MNTLLKQELISFWIETLKALGMPKWVIRRAMGLTPLAMHILTERSKMTRKLWLDTMWRDKWICYLCHEGRRANDPFEAEHKIALFNWGYTTLDNLGCAHKSCNRRKGTKRLEDQILYPALTMSKNIMIVILFILLLLSWIFYQILPYLRFWGR